MSHMSELDAQIRDSEGQHLEPGDIVYSDRGRGTVIHAEADYTTVLFKGADYPILIDTNLLTKHGA